MQIINADYRYKRTYRRRSHCGQEKNKLYAINWKARRAWNWSVSTLKIFTVNTSFFYFCRPHKWAMNVQHFSWQIFYHAPWSKIFFSFFFSHLLLQSAKKINVLSMTLPHLWTWMFASCLTGFWPFFSLSNSWLDWPATLYLLDLATWKSISALQDSELNLRLWSPN